MKQYKVIIKFNDGDGIDTKVVARNQSDALQRIMTNEQAIDFIASKQDVKSVDISLIGELADVPDNPQRFVLSPSAEREGWIVATDRMTNMVFIFMEGSFNDTVEVKPLEDMTPLDTATAIRELGEWLRLYHSDILIPTSETRQFNRIRLGENIAEERKKRGMTLRELASASGVSFQNITKIENGKYNVSIDILDKLCKALGLKIDLNGL